MGYYFVVGVIPALCGGWHGKQFHRHNESCYLTRTQAIAGGEGGLKAENIALTSISFYDLRRGSFAFVDKTGHVAEFLAAEPTATPLSQRAFFIRPRRFGKSTTLDIAKTMLTVGEIPDNVKEWRNAAQVDIEKCFSGTEVHTLYSEGRSEIVELLQTACFVITLSLGAFTTAAELRSGIIYQFAGIARLAFGTDLDVSRQTAISTAFNLLITNVPQNVPVAVLVDEYDAAILNDVQARRWDTAREGISVLSSLLSLSKDLLHNQRIRHFIVAGVARFAFTSIFSGANNLLDLTGHPLVSKMLGFSEEEIVRTYPNALQILATSNGFDSSALVLQELERLFNGYSFDGQCTSFNPYLVLSSLQTGTLSQPPISTNTWLGLKSRVVVQKLMADESPRKLRVDVAAYQLDIAQLENDSEEVKVLPLLLQVGLLSRVPGGGAGLSAGQVKVSNELIRSPSLFTIPNDYARQSLLRMMSIAQLIPDDIDAVAISMEILTCCKDFNHMAVSRIISTLLQGIPYILASPGDATLEAPYSTALYMILRISLPFNLASVVCEKMDAAGRADIIISFATRSVVWIFEVGVDSDGTQPNLAAAKLNQASRYRDSCLEPELLCCTVIISKTDPPSKEGVKFDTSNKRRCQLVWRRRLKPFEGQEWKWEQLGDD